MKINIELQTYTDGGTSLVTEEEPLIVKNYFGNSNLVTLRYKDQTIAVAVRDIIEAVNRAQDF